MNQLYFSPKRDKTIGERTFRKCTNLDRAHPVLFPLQKTALSEV